MDIPQFPIVGRDYYLESRQQGPGLGSCPRYLDNSSGRAYPICAFNKTENSYLGVDRARQRVPDTKHDVFHKPLCSTGGDPP